MPELFTYKNKTIPYWNPDTEFKIPGHMSSKSVILPSILGEPPQSSISYGLSKNTLPIMEIIPSRPHYNESVTLFRLISDMDKYETMLKKLDYSLSERPVKLAFIVDNFPTETFTNTYSETFLDRYAGTVSTGAAELSQLTGQRTADKALTSILKGLESSNSGIISAIGSGGQSLIKGMTNVFDQIVNSMGKKRASSFKNLVGKLLAGYRPDMPMIWKDSSYTPSYTITVRLYNPVPSDAGMREKYIIGPLAAILLLALPQTDDGTYYNWPFFHQIKVPGLFDIQSGFISNISIVKGGDQQQITYRQELGVVDVRIEFGSLFGTMVVGNDFISNNRPTLKNYIDNLKNPRDIYSRNEQTGYYTDEGNYKISKDIDNRQNQGTIDVESEPSDRISSTDYNNSTSLLLNQPSF